MTEGRVADCNKIVHSPNQPFTKCPSRRRPCSRARRLETALQCYWKKASFAKIAPSAIRPGAAISQPSGASACARVAVASQTEQADSTSDVCGAREDQHEHECTRSIGSQDDMSSHGANLGLSVNEQTRVPPRERRRTQRPASAGSNRGIKGLANVYRRIERPTSARSARGSPRSEKAAQELFETEEGDLESRETKNDAKFRALLARQASPLKARSTNARAVGTVQRQDALAQRRDVTKRRASAPSYDHAFKHGRLETTWSASERGSETPKRPTSAPSCRTTHASQVPSSWGQKCRGSGGKEQIGRNFTSSGFDAWLASETILAHADLSVDIEESVPKTADPTVYDDVQSWPKQHPSDQQKRMDGKKGTAARSVLDSEPVPCPVVPPPIKRTLFRPVLTNSCIRGHTISGHARLKQHEHASPSISRTRTHKPVVASTCHPACLSSCCAPPVESVPLPTFNNLDRLESSCTQRHSIDNVIYCDALDGQAQNRSVTANDLDHDSESAVRPRPEKYLGEDQDASAEMDYLCLARIETNQQDCCQSALQDNMERAGTGIPWSAVFNRLSRDGELHRDQLPEALELGAMQEVTKRHIDYALDNLTKYTTLNLEEFERFIELYIETLRKEHLTIFGERDANGSGLVDIASLMEWLGEVNIKPMRHVLAEILEDLGAAECRALDFTQFEKLLETIKLREGFSKFEFNRIIGAFDMYDLDRSGTLDCSEIAVVLDHLFYSLDRRAAIRIVQDTDLDGSGTIGIREFLVSMRKIREAEIQRISEYFLTRRLSSRRTVQNRASVTQLQSHRGECHLEGIMYMLGYVPDYEALAEAAREVGLYVPTKNLHLCDAWKFLEVYRAREGFTQSEANDINYMFEKFSTREGNEFKLEKRNLDFALRYLGYNASREVRLVLFRDADLDNSGSLGCTEFKRLVRKFREIELAQVRRSMKEVGQKHNRSELDDETFDMMEELRLLRGRRKSFRQNEGYSPYEVELFEAMFSSYDRDGGGSLGKDEMRMLFEAIIPELATSQNQRPVLVRLLSEVDDGDSQLNFREFLGLMRRFDTINNEAHMQREEDVAQEAGFCMQDVEQFRRLFVAADEGRKDYLTFDELRRLLSAVVPPGDRAVLKLRKLWHKVAPDADSEGLDFPALLSLLKHLLDNPMVVKPLSAAAEFAHRSPLQSVTRQL